MLAMLQGANRLEHRLRRLAAQKCGMTSRNMDMNDMNDLDCRWPAPYYDEAGNRIVMADDRGEQAPRDRNIATVLVRRVALHGEYVIPVVGRLAACRNECSFTWR
jgi:hypothetical protein